MPSRIARATVCTQVREKCVGLAVVAVEVTEDQRLVLGQDQRQRAALALPGTQCGHGAGVEIHHAGLPVFVGPSMTLAPCPCYGSGQPTGAP